MKRWIWIVGLLVLVGGGFFAFQSGTLPGASQSATAIAEQTTAATEPLMTANLATTANIVADARLVPVRRTDLSLPVGGIVAEVLVAEGDHVDAGQPLVRLDANQQQVAVARAQADLQGAQARLAELTAAPRPQEVASAQAALRAAQARYDQLAEASLPGDVAAAEAALSGSQASLAKVLEGASDQQLIAARADLANAAATLQQAQRAYDLVKWRNDLAALPQSSALQQATNAYEAAQARLADLERGASQADIAAASAQVQRAQAQLAALRTGMTPQMTAAQADVQTAQAQLELLNAGPRAETIAVAEAEIAAATSALQQAYVALGETELRAPFAGVIAALETEVGEQATPGATLIRLADLTQWEVETEDLTELDITALKAGMNVDLTFDAIPDLEMSGAIKRIRPIGQDNRGDIVYTVLITPAQQDDRFLWNMTAAVTVR
ncbi:MAG: HlyD family efflux transporter periplasmic adaptor subunit [Caldilineaceae bacterium]